MVKIRVDRLGDGINPSQIVTTRVAGNPRSREAAPRSSSVTAELHRPRDIPISITDSTFLGIQQLIKDFRDQWVKIKEQFFNVKSTFNYEMSNFYLDSAIDELKKFLLKQTINNNDPKLSIFNFTKEKLKNANSQNEIINSINSFHSIYTPDNTSYAENAWNQLNDNLKESLFQEQKHKYGTNAFRNTQMLRSLTDYAKKRYKKFIEEQISKFSSSFPARISLLGIGFGGAAFKLEIPNLSPIVIKMNLTKTDSSEQFGSLKDDKVGLEELEDVVSDFSQKLVYFDVVKNGEGSKSYLIPQDLENEILATWLQDGINIMDIVEDQWQNFLENNDPNEVAKKYFDQGISDTNLQALILYHLNMSSKEINFYDMFPHNTLFYENNGDPTFRFVDSSTDAKQGSIEAKIALARKNYPYDSMVYDLISFLVLQEQNHPMTISIRRALRSYLRKLNNTNSEDSIYDESRLKRFDRIKKNLDNLIEAKSIDLTKLTAALSRLNAHFNSSNPSERHPAQAFYKDFDRITENGKKFIGKLYEYYSEKQI